MKNHRPRNVIAVLSALAILGLVGSGLLDVHDDWGNPRQAAANICWIVFLVASIGLLITGARLLLRRRQPTGS